MYLLLLNILSFISKDSDFANYISDRNLNEWSQYTLHIEYLQQQK